MLKPLEWGNALVLNSLEHIRGVLAAIEGYRSKYKLNC